MGACYHQLRKDSAAQECMEGEAPAEPFRRTYRDLSPGLSKVANLPLVRPVVAVLDQIPRSTNGYLGGVCDDQEYRHPLCLGPPYSSVSSAAGLPPTAKLSSTKTAGILLGSAELRPPRTTPVLALVPPQMNARRHAPRGALVKFLREATNRLWYDFCSGSVRAQRAPGCACTCTSFYSDCVCEDAGDCLSDSCLLVRRLRVF